MYHVPSVEIGGFSIAMLILIHTYSFRSLAWLGQDQQGLSICFGAEDTQSIDVHHWRNGRRERWKHLMPCGRRKGQNIPEVFRMTRVSIPKHPNKIASQWVENWIQLWYHVPALCAYMIIERAYVICYTYVSIHTQVDLLQWKDTCLLSINTGTRGCRVSLLPFWFVLYIKHCC